MVIVIFGVLLVSVVFGVLMMSLVFEMLAMFVGFGVPVLSVICGVLMVFGVPVESVLYMWLIFCVQVTFMPAAVLSIGEVVFPVLVLLPVLRDLPDRLVLLVDGAELPLVGSCQYLQEQGGARRSKEQGARSKEQSAITNRLLFWGSM